MKFLRPELLLFFLLIPIAAFAQEQQGLPETFSPTVSDCSQEMFEKAELFFRNRLWRGPHEKELKSIVVQCPDAPWNNQVSEFLKTVREERASHSLRIALYYQRKYYEGEGRGLRGAWSRYKEIVEKYPEYSQIDRVLLLLGNTEIELGYFDEAAESYMRIINEFPASEYVKNAYRQLAVLETEKIRRSAVQ